MITLTIPVPSPSLNSFYGQHWTRKLKAFKQWRRWIWALGRHGTNRSEAEAMEFKRHVTIDRYGARLLDFDNFCGGAKGILDALVAEGFLFGDSPAHVTVEYHQHISRERKTIISIQGHDQWKSSATKQPTNSSEASAPRTETASARAVTIAEQLL